MPNRCKHKLNFSNPSGEVKKFYSICITYIGNADFRQKMIGRCGCITYIFMVQKWNIQQITHFIANWNFMFWHDWKLHKTLIFLHYYRVLYIDHIEIQMRDFFLYHHVRWIIQINFWTLLYGKKTSALENEIKNKHKNLIICLKQRSLAVSLFLKSVRYNYEWEHFLNEKYT